MSRISYGTCDLCGDINATVAPEDDNLICRVCDPDNWLRVSKLQKQAWLRGEVDDKGIWNKPGHSQR